MLSLLHHQLYRPVGPDFPSAEEAAENSYVLQRYNHEHDVFERRLTDYTNAEKAMGYLSETIDINYRDSLKAVIMIQAGAVFDLFLEESLNEVGSRQVGDEKLTFIL